MKDDGMLDDPSYVAEECKCASNWVEFKEPTDATEDIEVDSSEELEATLPTLPTDTRNGKPIVHKSHDHLSTYTCACIIIFAVQAIICFAISYWTFNKEQKIARSKVIK